VSARITAGSRSKRFVCFVLIDVICFLVPLEMSSRTPGIDVPQVADHSVPQASLLLGYEGSDSFSVLECTWLPWSVLKRDPTEFPRGKISALIMAVTAQKVFVRRSNSLDINS
jgi:hypothetical protein